MLKIPGRRKGLNVKVTHIQVPHCPSSLQCGRFPPSGDAECLITVVMVVESL